jgi:CheY-like chemotaxis protein
MKILLVDDANLFLEVTRQILKPMGAQILVARSGLEAMKILETDKPDLIILDLMMPEMGGDKVCLHVKGHPKYHDIPVIMVTSRGRPEELEKCRQAGCDDFLTKPIKPEVLLEKVSQLSKRSTRHTIQVLVRVETENKLGKEVSFGTSADLSKTGMSIQTEKTFEMGQAVTVRFFVNSKQDELVLNGKMVRKEGRGRSQAYGVHFDPLSLGKKQTLSGFIDSKRR